MAIPLEATFSHSVALRVGPDGVWRGTAQPADQELRLVGDAPAVELSGGILSFKRRSAANPRLFPGMTSGPPLTRVRLEVGEALETVIQDDDLLYADRGSMGELGLVLLRAGRIVMALGAVIRQLERAGVTVEVDPRTDDVRFYYMRSLLDREDSRLIWLDPLAPDFEDQLAELDRIPPHIGMVCIAARCDDMQTASEVNRRTVERRGGGPWGFNFETVGTRFRIREDFIAHLRGFRRVALRTSFSGSTSRERERNSGKGKARSTSRGCSAFTTCRRRSTPGPDPTWASRAHTGR